MGGWLRFHWFPSTLCAQKRCRRRMVVVWSVMFFVCGCPLLYDAPPPHPPTCPCLSVQSIGYAQTRAAATTATTTMTTTMAKVRVFLFVCVCVGSCIDPSVPAGRGRPKPPPPPALTHAHKSRRNNDQRWLGALNVSSDTRFSRFECVRHGCMAVLQFRDLILWP